MLCNTQPDMLTGEKEKGSDRCTTVVFEGDTVSHKSLHDLTGK